MRKSISANKICMEKVAILAAYNLENSIGEIVERTKKFVDAVIVVTDGSKDDTKSAGYIPDNSPKPIIVRDMIIMLNGENT